jgi:hypothetical protein
MLVAVALTVACTERAPSVSGERSCEGSDVLGVVRRFGERIRLVPLQAPDSVIAREVRNAYAGLVTRELLDAWTARPNRAPGRLTSSPWPERIEVDSVRTMDGLCVVDGTLIHLTSVEVVGGGAAVSEPVTVIVRATSDSGWRVGAFRSRYSGSDTESTASQSGDRDAAVEVIRAYYASINAGEYRTAYHQWEDSGRASGQSFDDFAAGYARTERVEVDIGTPGRIEGAAGSRYLEIPVVLRAATAAGARQRFEGSYTLRRSVVDGAAPEMRRWHIYSARINRVPRGPP